MSTDSLSSAASPGPGGEDDSLGWLKELLRTAMEAVMAAEEGSAIQKANTVARLGNLYLKACQVTELRQTHKALVARVAELEQANRVPAERIASPAQRLPVGIGGEALLEVSAAHGETANGGARHVSRSIAGTGIGLASGAASTVDMRNSSVHPLRGYPRQALRRSPIEVARMLSFTSPPSSQTHPRRPLSSPALTRAPRKNGPN